MQYHFSKFLLNTVSKELILNGKPVELTRKYYELLLLFVENPQQVFSKDDLIKRIWTGKYVTENTIDQSISILRKILGSVQTNDFIKTVYGKGFKFVPKVTKIIKKTPPKVSRFSYALPIIIFLFGVFIFVHNRDKEVTDKAPESLLLIISDSQATEDNSSLNQSSVTFFDQLLRLSNAAKIKSLKDKPKYQEPQQYIDNQWRFSPHLKVVTTHVSQDDNLYTVTLDIADKLQQLQTQSFTDKSLSIAMKLASQWLTIQVGRASAFAKIESLIPDDSYLVELYMRGLASQARGEIDKALNFFELCIQEKQDFYLARLHLAEVLSSKGKPEKALAMLDTLANSNVYPQMEIEVEKLRASIFDTQGKLELARDIYLDLLAKFEKQDIPQLNSVRFKLSYTYTVMTEFDKALEQLNILENNIVAADNPTMLANIYHKKSSILQKLGHTKLAKQNANKALAIFSKLQNLLGTAKTYIALARISTHQAKYNESVEYLQQSLAINKKLGYKLGIGATLNELIFILMLQGQFSQAWDLNQQMQEIALDIDYNAMLQISKQYATDMSRAKKDYVKAEIYLQEHLNLAKAANNTRALLKNKLLKLDLLLDQKKTDNVAELIKEVQKYIDTTGEIRLQPRINKQLARYYLLTEQVGAAIELFQTVKVLATKTQDGETLMEVNNLLAEYFINSNQAQKALATLEESFELQPMPYPFLLLQSKANKMLGNNLIALDLANECKQSSNQLWSLDDDRYLSELL
ncbi:MAG: tetratricopeptide repeat protein [Proteobacteria bacterium]|nr:tetratricopeptide repeat protein [Pseudomonadota bacterium]